MQSMSMMAERLRAMLASPQGIELPGCYDALSAMILERAGFPAIFMSGYGVAASLLGNPDIGLTSLVETAHMARNISNAIRVPLVVDADNGYGNEDSVVRTVRELEQAGAAAMILGAVGLIAAERERRSRRLAKRSPEQLPRGLTSSPAANAR
jgi:2-methylisocitrate lyase-like PEP mutase family enzyme